MGNKSPLACIFSLKGPVLSDSEYDFFQEAKPLGFILFGRNIESPDQIKKLIEDLRSCLGWDCPILIDQEGGRVQRMRAPHWMDYPPMLALAQDQGALQETVQAIAKDLIAAGIDVNCAPVLDLLYPDTDDSIGDRAFSDDPQIAAQCGLIVCETLLEFGITPVIKHLPGQGRARTDSHKELPKIDANIIQLEKDYEPFEFIVDSHVGDQVWGMVGHALYDAYGIDLPASACARAIDIIREDIGFEGLLLSDDLDMNALQTLGDIPARAKAVIDAGCDLALYCHGDLDIMKNLAETLPPMRVHSINRYDTSRIRRRSAA